MRAFSLPLILVTLSGCMLLGRAEDDPLPAPAERARGCVEVERPGTLPSVETVLDSELVLREASDWLGSQYLFDDPGEVVFTLEFDEEGMNIRREVIEHTVTTVQADSLQRIVFTAREEVDHPELPWSVRLRMSGEEGDVSPVLEVERSIFCSARPRDTAMERSLFGTPARIGRRHTDGRRERTITVRVFVAPQGYVSHTEVVDGPPISTDQHNRIQDHMRQFFFEPARLDGLPVTGHLDIPLRILI